MRLFKTVFVRVFQKLGLSSRWSEKDPASLVIPGEVYPGLEGTLGAGGNSSVPQGEVPWVRRYQVLSRLHVSQVLIGRYLQMPTSQFEGADERLLKASFQELRLLEMQTARSRAISPSRRSAISICGRTRRRSNQLMQ